MSQFWCSRGIRVPPYSYSQIVVLHGLLTQKTMSFVTAWKFNESGFIIRW
jgi:hypothetical protein